MVDRLTGDRMLVHVFRLMLLAAVVVLGLDLRQLWLQAPAAADAPLVAPGGPVPLPFRQPVRAPASGSPPPNKITSDPETLAAPLSVELLPGGVLALTGTIDPGAALRLRAELEARGEYVGVVRLDSPGGSVNDALEMAAMLRERQLTARVESGALCASSCPIVLAGGAVREVSAQASVGVHQIFASDADRLDPRFDGMAQAQRTTARIGRHLAAMGIDGALWLHALETPKDALYYLTADELTGFELATVILDRDAD